MDRDCSLHPMVMIYMSYNIYIETREDAQGDGVYDSCSRW